MARVLRDRFVLLYLILEQYGTSTCNRGQHTVLMICSVTTSTCHTCGPEYAYVGICPTADPPAAAAYPALPSTTDINATIPLTDAASLLNAAAAALTGAAPFGPATASITASLAGAAAAAAGSSSGTSNGTSTATQARGSSGGGSKSKKGSAKAGSKSSSSGGGAAAGSSQSQGQSSGAGRSGSGAAGPSTAAATQPATRSATQSAGASRAGPSTLNLPSQSELDFAVAHSTARPSTATAAAAAAQSNSGAAASSSQPHDLVSLLPDSLFDDDSTDTTEPR